MKLETIEREIDYIVLERGREYLVEGRIIALEHIGDGEYQATVEGNDLYEVNVTVATDGTIVESDCDCPYDLSPVCKRQVAVLLQLRADRMGLGGPDDSGERELRRLCTIPLAFSGIPTIGHTTGLGWQALC